MMIASRWLKGGGAKKRDTLNDAKLQGIISNQGVFKKSLFICPKLTGAWLIVGGNTVNGTVRAATDFRDIFKGLLIH